MAIPEFPAELYLGILHQLPDCKTLHNCYLVCHMFHELILQNEEPLWKSLCLKLMEVPPDEDIFLSGCVSWKEVYNKRFHKSFNKGHKQLTETLAHLKPNEDGLFLKGMKLQVLPSKLTDLTQLKTLSLTATGMKILPPEIGGLSNLQSLYLSFNKLTTLPASLCKLSKLQLLGASNNRIEYLPEELSQLVNLQVVYLSFNQMKWLPLIPVCKWTKLQVLHFNNNEIPYLAHLAKLVNLSCLLPRSTLATLFDARFGSLTNLHELKFDQLNVGNYTATQMIAARKVNVLYHCPCPDGGFAALAAYLRFHKEKHTELTFIPHQTFNKLNVDLHPEFTPQSEVYLLDYIGPPSFAVDLARKVKKVTIIDHHKTAFETIDQYKSQNNIPDNLEVNLKLDKSGATLAWDYFSKEKELAEDPELKQSLLQLYSYIEDTDLWRRALPHAKQFQIGLGNRSIEYDIKKNPSLFLQLQLLKADELIAEGKVKSADLDDSIQAELENSFLINLGGQGSEFGQCLALLTQRPQLRSEMGHQLAEKSSSQGYRGIGAIVYNEELMQNSAASYKVSLRSISDEDTSVISKQFGGGGHKNASSFALAKEIFDSWRA